MLIIIEKPKKYLNVNIREKQLLIFRSTIESRSSKKRKIYINGNEEMDVENRISLDNKNYINSYKNTIIKINIQEYILYQVNLE